MDKFIFIYAILICQINICLLTILFLLNNLNKTIYEIITLFIFLKYQFKGVMFCNSKLFGLRIVLFQLLSLLCLFITTEVLYDHSIISNDLLITFLLCLSITLTCFYILLKRASHRVLISVLSLLLCIATISYLFFNRNTVGYSTISWNSVMRLIKDVNNNKIKSNTTVSKWIKRNSISVLFYEDINTYKQDKDVISTDRLERISKKYHNMVYQAIENRTTENDPVVVNFCNTRLNLDNSTELKAYCKMLNEIYFSRFSRNLIILIKMKDLENLKKNGFNRPVRNRVRKVIKGSVSDTEEDSMSVIEEDELYLEEETLITKKMPFSGLKNIGYMCYANCLIQSFYHIPEFKEKVLNCEPVDKILQLQNIFRELEENDGTTVDPEEFVNNLMGGSTQQQDIHDFFMIFLGIFEVEDPKDEKNRQKTEVLALTEGLFSEKSKLSCENETKSNQKTFNDLLLSIKDPTDDSNLENLTSALDLYFKDAEMTEPNQLYCKKDDKYVDGVISTKIQEMPQILCLTLKRYKYNTKIGKNQKINDKFDFPKEIDLRPYCSDQGEPIKYKLYSVSVHIGDQPGKGHYKCYISIKDVWYCFNDEKVSVVDESTAIDNNFGGEEKNGKTKSYSAYFLIYLRL